MAIYSLRKYPLRALLEKQSLDVSVEIYSLHHFRLYGLVNKGVAGAIEKTESSKISRNENFEPKKLQSKNNKNF